MSIFTHLKERHLNPSLYPNITIDEESNTATFPIFSFSHRMIGYQQYNPSGSKTLRRDPKLGRYFTYLSEPGVWGLESLFLFPPKIVFVCESIFKACRMHNLGYPAIATLTNNPVSIRSSILSLAPKVIVIPDPDEAGNKLCKYGHEFYVPPKPLDDMSELGLQVFFSSLNIGYGANHELH